MSIKHPLEKKLNSSVGTPVKERLFHPQHEKPQTKSTLQQGGHADNGNFYCLMIGQSSATRFMEDLLLPCLIACTRGQTQNITPRVISMWYIPIKSAKLCWFTCWNTRHPGGHFLNVEMVMGRLLYLTKPRIVTKSVSFLSETVADKKYRIFS